MEAAHVFKTTSARYTTPCVPPPVFIASSVISMHQCNTCQHPCAEFTCNLQEQHGDKTEFRDVRLLIL